MVCNNDDKNLTTGLCAHGITRVSFTCGALGLGGHVVIGVVLGFITQTQYPWWSRCHWCRARFHHADAIPSVEFSSLLDFVVHLCTCSQTGFCDRQFSSVANYCTPLHRENGSFEVLSSHHPSITADRRQL